MSYRTTFEGELEITPAIDEKTKVFVNELNRTRRMKRDEKLITQIDPDWKKHCFAGKIGIEGEYYTVPESLPVDALKHPEIYQGNTAFDPYGQLNDISVVDENKPPRTQPSLWCSWRIDRYGRLEWDGNEKFDQYEEWLEYLIKDVFTLEGYTLNGEITCTGEDGEEEVIIVKNNVVSSTYDLLDEDDL